MNTYPKQKHVFIIVILAIIILLGGVVAYLSFVKKTEPVAVQVFPTPTIAQLEQSPTPADTIVYNNYQYHFRFTLPLSWKGYSIVMSTWEGYNPENNNNVVVEKGQMISIRHPLWTEKNPYQDIPIMIFSLDQWKSLQQGTFHIGAAPINPSKLGQNATTVFALPARYNFSFPTGFEEVEKILQNNPLQAY